MATNGFYIDADGKKVTVNLSDIQKDELIKGADLARAEAILLNEEANNINGRFGAGSPIRIISTAINGAAGGNAAGGFEYL